MSTYNYAPGAVHLDIRHSNINMSASSLAELVRSVRSNATNENTTRDAEDITPEEERAKLEAPHENIFLHRDRGTGRPTKKDRRILDKIMAGFD